MKTADLIKAAKKELGHDPNEQEFAAYLTWPGRTKQNAIEDTHTHDWDHFEKAKNDFSEDQRGLIQMQQGSLQNGIVQVETQIVNAVLNKVTKNKFDDEDEIINKTDREQAERELKVILEGFYKVLLPILAARVISKRQNEFNETATFQVTPEVTAYITYVTAKAAHSHTDTVVRDLLKSMKLTYESVVEREAQRIADDAGRAVTDADLVLARSRSLSGATQREIVSAITTEYADITRDRAKVIARTETNRAFTQAQFQADLQFIAENNLENRAYKKWRTRSDNPCAICNKLASEPAIPFKNNFRDIGDDLEAVYEVNGKTRVLKQVVNFEELSAGNAHVNCACIYELIIK